MMIRGLGALTADVVSELQAGSEIAFSSLNESTTALNIAARSGATPEGVRVARSEHDQLVAQLTEYTHNVPQMQESEARALLNSIQTQARANLRRAQDLAGQQTSTTKMVVWGAGITLAAVAITYGLWKFSKRRRR